MKKVYEKVCPVCGKDYVTEKKNQVCCCRKCSNKIKSRRIHNYDASLVWERVPSDQSLWQCPYRECVACKTRDCDKCGWNPVVEKRRKAALLKRYAAMEQAHKKEA